MKKLTSEPDDMTMVCSFLREHSRFDADRIKAQHDKLSAYEDTGMTPEEIKKVQAAVNPIPFGRFREIMEAERDGRCVVLPCKVGDRIYVLETKCDYEDECYNTTRPCCRCKHEGEKYQEVEVRIASWSDMQTINDGFGKTVFLTRPNAEAALNKSEASK
jgi:hypothetical protein